MKKVESVSQNRCRGQWLLQNQKVLSSIPVHTRVHIKACESEEKGGRVRWEKISSRANLELD